MKGSKMPLVLQTWALEPWQLARQAKYHLKQRSSGYGDFSRASKYDVMNEHAWSPEASKSRDAALKMMQFISGGSVIVFYRRKWPHWQGMALGRHGSLVWNSLGSAWGGHLVMTPHLVFNQCPHVWSPVASKLPRSLIWLFRSVTSLVMDLRTLL